jgi:large subunit ribosomal protein L2
MYRLMNHQLPAGTKAVVEHIEYDPNRSARIARIKDQNGMYHYIIAARDMTIGKQS